MKSQEQQILEYLQAGNSITPLEALRLFSCFRLGARCYDLKQAGYPIRSELVSGENNKHFARYWLEKKEEYIFTEEPKQLAFIR